MSLRDVIADIMEMEEKEKKMELNWKSTQFVHPLTGSLSFFLTPYSGQRTESLCKISQKLGSRGQWTTRRVPPEILSATSVFRG